MLHQTPLLLLVMAAAGIAMLLMFGIAMLGSALFTVEQRTVAIVQRLGKFLREAGPGLHIKIPFVDRVAGRVSLRMQQLELRIETKTQDDAFVHIGIAVQYYVVPERIQDAFYQLDDATTQITSSVLDVVRARVPGITLDDLFDRKDEIADMVTSELARAMEGSGHGILRAMVTEIEPAARVKESMNEINAAQRMASRRQAVVADLRNVPGNGS